MDTMSKSKLDVMYYLSDRYGDWWEGEGNMEVILIEIKEGVL